MSFVSLRVFTYAYPVSFLSKCHAKNRKEPQRSSCGSNILLQRSSCVFIMQPQRSSCGFQDSSSSDPQLAARRTSSCGRTKKFLRMHYFWAVLYMYMYSTSNQCMYYSVYMYMIRHTDNNIYDNYFFKAFRPLSKIFKDFPKFVTFHAKTYFNSFPFSNGIPFRGRFKAVSKKFAFVRTTWVIRSKKFTSVRTPLITRSTETASRSNDLLTRSVKVFTRSNDLLTRSIKVVQPFERLAHPFVKNIQPFERLTRLLEHPSIQTT